ncbi:hypothetical protein Scep_018922 [Stephania cephalantha]|uniref:Mannan endo-1,4-beta-mannosidase n=1 Tax=Stephania cephalantha TaxID=152367 RepID=A0AAP0I9W7_9MAGN
MSCICVVALFSLLLCQAITALGAFVGTSNAQFVLNGSPFLFDVFNSYWMMDVAVDPNQCYKVSNVFRDASSAGLTVCRTWAFSDGGGRALQTSPGVYNEATFQALDFVISENVESASIALNRQRHTIMALELMKKFDTVITFGYVVVEAGKHGVEGFCGDSVPDRKQFNPGYQVGTDFISNNLIKEIDFATIHAYPDIWRISSIRFHGEVGDEPLDGLEKDTEEAVGVRGTREVEEGSRIQFEWERLT